MKTTWLIHILMWLYDAVMGVVKAISMALAAGFILATVAKWPWLTNFMLDAASTISDPIKDSVYGYFPDAVQKARQIGGLFGTGVRWMFSFTDAQVEAVGRIVLLEGAALWTLTTMTLFVVIKFWAKRKVARWFNRRYVILRRLKFEAFTAGFKELRSENKALRDENAELRKQLAPPKSSMPTSGKNVEDFLTNNRRNL